MNLRTLDLNLLVVLQQLLVERHVSRASEQLNMSQPAVSRALQRLREMLDDPLLVRTSKGYELSTRAQDLLPKLNQLLTDTESLISGPEFDPARSTQTIRFYGSDPEIMRFLPPLFERMNQLAPNMALEAISDPKDHFAQLESGDVHFVLSSLQPSAHISQLRSMKLADLDFALVMSADNPLAQGEISLQQYIEANHGVISITGRGPVFMEERLRNKGLLKKEQHLNIPVRLSNFSSVASFCERSNVLFHLPREFVEEVVRGRNLVVRDSLEEIRIEDIATYLYWHERFHKDPMCRWVRQQMKVLYQK